jgi:hypothetical protein
MYRNALFAAVTILGILSAVLISPTTLRRLFARPIFSAMTIPKTQPEWRKALESLPNTSSKIPVFFFAHGSPLLAFPESSASGFGSAMVSYAGPKGPLATFLRDLGPALLDKYKPTGIVVFSAHWETYGERLGNCVLCVTIVVYSRKPYSDRLWR